MPVTRAQISTETPSGGTGEIFILPTLPVFKIERVAEYEEVEGKFLTEPVLIYGRTQPLEVTFEWETAIIQYDGGEPDFPHDYGGILETLKFVHSLVMPGAITDESLNFEVPPVIRFIINPNYVEIRGVVKSVTTEFLPPYCVLPSNYTGIDEKYEFLPQALKVSVSMMETYLYSTDIGTTWQEIYQETIKNYGDLVLQGSNQRTRTGVINNFYGRITP